MNIVDLIKDQLSGELLGKLGSVLGTNEATTTKAVSGAVPSLLSVLAGLASSGGGAEKLVDVLKKFDSNSLGNVVNSLRSGNVKEVEQKGGDVLGSLLGGGTLATIVNLLSQFAGVGSGSGKSLLSLLAPLILGVISSQFKNKPLNPAGLTSFFEEQKSNIACHASGPLDSKPSGADLRRAPRPPRRPRACPAGCSRSWPSGHCPPRLVFLEPAARGTLARATAGPGPAVAVKPPVVPDSPDFLSELTKVYTSATDSLAKVKDVPSAEAAAPTLQGLASTVDKMKPLFDKLPESAKTAVAALQSKNLDPLKELITKVLAITGVGEKLKPILDDLVAKLSALK